MYKFNKKTLQYEKINLLRPILFSVFLLIGLVALTSFINKKEIQYVQTEQEMTISTDNQFSEQRLALRMMELNIKNPDIVYAQFVLESGDFKSNIFLENNNFAGMKMALKRPTTAQGTLNGHALYNNWEDCLIDYGFYQSAYLKNLNRQQYINYLSKNYAEDTLYVNKVINIANSNKVKKLFE